MTKYPAQATTLLHTNSFQTMNPVVVGILEFQKALDIKKMSTALNSLKNFFPQAFCRYELTDNTFTEIPTLSLDDSFHFLAKGKTPYQYNLDFLTGPQFHLFYQEMADNGMRLYFLESHLVADGRGLKEVMKAFLTFYHDPKANLGENHQDLEDVLKNLPTTPPTLDRPDHGDKNLQIDFPKATGPLEKKIHQIAIEKEGFLKLHQKAKEQQLSLNDLFLTTYLKLLKNYNPNEPWISMSCPTDTRQFLTPTQQKQYYIGNFTARYTLQVSLAEKEDFLTSAKKVHEEMNLLKENYQFLQSTLTLIENYRKFSIAELRDLAKKNYHMRSLAYTNMSVLPFTPDILPENTLLQAYTSGAFRKAPSFQVCFSTFNNQLNLVANVIGDAAQQDFAYGLLLTMKKDLLQFI